MEIEQSKLNALLKRGNGWITLTKRFKILQCQYSTAMKLVNEQQKIIENLRKDKREIKLILESIFKDDFVL